MMNEMPYRICSDNSYSNAHSPKSNKIHLLKPPHTNIPGNNSFKEIAAGKNLLVRKAHISFIYSQHWLQFMCTTLIYTVFGVSLDQKHPPDRIKFK